ncbi:MAG: divalent-cation tolerance protein CutA [Rhodospirillales bacterium]|nr:divalent-cation tolerance protein CutA [Rhodospirillales bacterium]
MQAMLLYVTAGSRDEALRLGRAVVEKRLAACANIVGETTSIYRWEGELQEDAEVALILKTRAALVDDATAEIKRLHSYDCPCVVALPIDGGNDEFLNWIINETS